MGCLHPIIADLLASPLRDWASVLAGALFHVEGTPAPSFHAPENQVSQPCDDHRGERQAKPDHYDLPPVVIGHWSRSRRELGGV